MTKTETIKNDLVPRFIEYAKIHTSSDRHIAEIPSTPQQWDLLNLLKKQLTEDFGLKDVNLNENGYLIARLPSNIQKTVPCIGFIAHVDTSSDAPGKDVKPQIHKNYQGGIVSIGNKQELNPEIDKDLLTYMGKDIICSDGTTLLGADDKAGIAEIMTAVKYFIENPEIAHGEIEIIFTPDEETGKGMDLFPYKDLHSYCCYSLDGTKLGEIEAECFNAYEADIELTGKIIHLGIARGQLVNAVTMAAKFISLLPQAESPEATDGRYGYYAPLEMSGTITKAEIKLLLRDFDLNEIHRRAEALDHFAKAVEAAFPGGTVSVKTKKQYYNMLKHFNQDERILGLLETAIEKCGVKPQREAIRGGTDGARLSEQGIPTPNIFTGGHNFHSCREWAGIYAMEKACETVIELIGLWAEN